ncbi:MAG: hypothetical protein RL417_163 [Pseudomonadota bacterium]|jgi:hypothetical protein
MLDERSKAGVVTGIWDSVAEVVGATALAGALSVGAHHAIAGYLPPSGPFPGGISGAALGDMGTGSSRSIVDKARAELKNQGEADPHPGVTIDPPSEG